MHSTRRAYDGLRLLGGCRPTSREGVVALLVFFSFSASVATAKDYSYGFRLWEEATATRINANSPFNPDNRWLDLPVWSNSLIGEGEGSITLNPRLKAGGGFVNRYDYIKGNADRLRLKELYLSWSIDSHWDITAGKKILKWGTGYAWTPTGVLDPTRDPRDPTDRLSQNEGRELLELRGTYGNHNMTVVFTSPRLFSNLQAEKGQRQWAFKYNALVKRLDYSLIAAFGGAESNRYGLNATYVIGQSLELHGEFLAHRGSPLLYPLSIAAEDPDVTYSYPPYGPLKRQDDRVYSRSLIGANYTFRWGLNLVTEYYRDGEGLTPIERSRFDVFVAYNEAQARIVSSPSSGISLPAANLLWTLQGIGGFNRARDYVFVRLSQDRLAKKWNLENIGIISLRDGGSIWIPQVSYDVRERVSVYARYTVYAGGRSSEFGSLPYRANCALGLALRF